MSLFQLALQVIAVCVLIAALVFGLFSAPWYVLFMLLLGTFVITWLLMPGRKGWISQFISPNGTDLPNESWEESVRQGAGESPQPAGNLTYRGAPYCSQIGAELDESSVLTYRGAPYSKGSQPPEPPAHGDSETSLHNAQSAGSPARELKYRGAKVNQ